MDKYDMQKRAMNLALEVIRLTKKFPACQEGKVVTYQIIKSSTSTAANYRAACRAKSVKDFISKLGIVEEECDESLFWLDFSIETHLSSSDIITPLKKEATEILKIVVASIKTARTKL